MRWKIYIRQMPIMTMMMIYPLIMAAKPGPEQDGAPTQATSQVDSIKNLIAHLSPEKLKQLRALYSETYGQITTARLASSNPTSAYTPSQDIVHLDGKRRKSEKLRNIETVRRYNQSDSIVIHNDTAYIPENLNLEKGFSWVGGMTYNDIPQIDINYFSYKGKNKALKKVAQVYNSMRLGNLVHELQHAKYRKIRYSLPIHQRSRNVWALDELGTMICSELNNWCFVKLDNVPKNWDKQYEVTIKLDDINYKIPRKNLQTVVNLAISNAVHRLSSDVMYRHEFINFENKAFSNEDLADAPNKTGTYAEAISKMRSAFKINGKKVDIFSLASDNVRKLAEDFINDRDEDMRLVIFAHDNKIKL